RFRDCRQFRKTARLRRAPRLRLLRDLRRDRRRCPPARSRARPNRARAAEGATRRRRVRIMRIGICGGTFDPFHRGHLEPVLAVRQTFGWDRIIYIPAARQPFKFDETSASAYHRFAMAQLATRNHDDVWVTPLELERSGTSYTVDTLEELHKRHDSAEFDWIIGDDNVADFDRWKSPERLLALARFVVLTRGEAQND